MPAGAHNSRDRTRWSPYRHDRDHAHQYHETWYHVHNLGGSLTTTYGIASWGEFSTTLLSPPLKTILSPDLPRCESSSTWLKHHAHVVHQGKICPLRLCSYPRVGSNIIPMIKDWDDTATTGHIMTTFGSIPSYALGHFLPDITACTTPLLEMAVNHQPFYWRPIHDTCFERIKQLCCSTPILRPIQPDLDEPIWVICDASI